jgi:hypothetical protein
MTLDSTIAPADAIAHSPWPLWRKFLAYFLLTLLASVSIWFIDRGAMQLLYSPPPEASPTPTRPEIQSPAKPIVAADIEHPDPGWLIHTPPAAPSRTQAAEQSH